MTGLETLALLFLVSKGMSSRKAVRGKSGRTWFVTDSTVKAKTGATVPVRDVFLAASGGDRVLSFALMPGSIRAWLFKASGTLAASAMSDFDVQDIRANV